jgi:acyl dehydratase
MTRYGKAFNELSIGDKIEEGITVTEAHLTNAAALFNDYNALHTNEPAMRRSRFGARIAHGALTFGLMVGVYSKYFRDTDISTVEASIKFTAPIYIGDTIRMSWEVVGLDPKPKLNGGLVTLSGRATNQKDTLVAETAAKLLVSNTTIFE